MWRTVIWGEKYCKPFPCLEFVNEGGFFFRLLLMRGSEITGSTGGLTTMLFILQKLYSFKLKARMNVLELTLNHTTVDSGSQSLPETTDFRTLLLFLTQNRHFYCLITPGMFHYPKRLSPLFINTKNVSTPIVFDFGHAAGKQDSLSRGKSYTSDYCFARLSYFARAAWWKHMKILNQLILKSWLNGWPNEDSETPRH